MKKIFKNLGKTVFARKFLSSTIYIYARLIKLTCKINYLSESGFNEKDFSEIKKHTFVTWHKNIILSTASFLMHKNKIPDLSLLVSPSNDGRFLINIAHWIGYNVIEGSTNKNSFSAIKKIFDILEREGNIAITPDGPRGPAEEINSSITSIIKKKNAVIIPIIFECSNYISLNSWDKMKIPLPFSKITVLFKSNIIPSNDESKDNKLLKDSLSNNSNKLT